MTEIDFCEKNTPKIDICTANKPKFEKISAEEKPVEKWLMEKTACGKLLEEEENFSIFSPFSQRKTRLIFLKTSKNTARKGWLFYDLQQSLYVKMA